MTTLTRWKRTGIPPLLTVAAWIVIAAVAFAAAFPDLITSADPEYGDFQRLLPPSAEHWFGTDNVGRDLYTRIVFGTRTSILAVVIAVFVGLIVGSLIGFVSGWFGGWLDSFLMRCVDVLLSIPTLLVTLAFIAVLGFGVVNLAIAVGLGSVASFARVSRSEVVRHKGLLYVEAAQFNGLSPAKVLVKHVLPGVLPPVLVLATLDAASAILMISALSFLGFGAPPPTPEWGALIEAGRAYFRVAWWLVLIPGIFISLTAVALNTIARSFAAGDGVRGGTSGQI